MLRLLINVIAGLALAQDSLAAIPHPRQDGDGATARYLDPKLSARDRSADLLQRMTWEEKVGQLGGIRRPVERTNGKAVFNRTTFERIKKTQNGNIGVGSQLNWVDDVVPIVSGLREEQINSSRLGIPFIGIADSINGIWISGGTLFPGASSMASSWNLPLYEEAIAAIRDENLAVGINWVLSPEVDLAKDPRNGRNGEMFGEDTFLAGAFATSYINTMQEKDEHGWVKVAATIKHWVYGSGSGGVNRASMSGGINHILNDLALPYVKAIKEAKPLSLMASYSTVDRVPISVNRYMLHDVLRGILGFEGLIMSDANAIEYLFTESKVANSRKDAALKALKAGLEHELHPGGGGLFVELLNAGDEPDIVALVDKSVQAFLEIKFTTGVFDRPVPSLKSAKKVLRSKHHLNANRDISRESIVLLQNDGLLPLNRKNVSRVAVIGPYADVINAGMYAACNTTDPRYGDSFRRSLERELGAGKVEYVEGTSIDPFAKADEAGIKAAVAAARAAQVAVVVLGSGLSSFDPSTFTKRTDGEGFSHPSLGFPGQQQQLLSAVLDTGVPTILILSSGQTFILNESTKRAGAILHSWLGGEFTGDSLVEILFGKTSPSGKLTVTIPQAEGAFPVAYDYLPSDDVGGFGVATTYDWHWPQATRYSPLRFGYGLSYTTFSIRDATIAVGSPSGKTQNATSIIVEASLKNTGKLRGKEVVQLYYRPVVSAIEFPVMKLIRFAKFDLAPGKSSQVKFSIPRHELGYYVDGEWHTDSGDYLFWIGNSSRTEDLQPLNVTVSA